MRYAYPHCTDFAVGYKTARLLFCRIRVGLMSQARSLCRFRSALLTPSAFDVLNYDTRHRSLVEGRSSWLKRKLLQWWGRPGRRVAV